MSSSEFISHAYKVFKAKPSEVTPEMITKLKELKEQEYQFRLDKSKPLEARITSFELQNRIHEILGFKQMEEKFKPKANGGAKGGWIATDEQRCKNVDGLIKKIGKETWNTMSPFEQGTIIARAWGAVKQ